MKTTTQRARLRPTPGTSDSAIQKLLAHHPRLMCLAVRFRSRIGITFDCPLANRINAGWPRQIHGGPVSAFVQFVERTLQLFEFLSPLARLLPPARLRHTLGRSSTSR